MQLKSLRIDPMVRFIRGEFRKIKDKRGSNSSIKQTDALLSGFAMFSLKDPSLLYFDNKRTVRKENLKKVYHIQQAPSDSGMRTILDDIDSNGINRVFKKMVDRLRKANVWKGYAYFRGYMVCSIDGTQHYSSECIKCEKCLVVKKSNGVLEYRHSLLSGSMVHPDKKEVIPVIHEEIVKQDGSAKNDCERNASKRLLPKLRKQFAKEKIVIVEDALGANGPHIKAIKAQGFEYVIGVKPKGNAYLFDLMDRMEAHKQGQVHHFEEQKGGLINRYRYANNLPLNGEHRDIRVNFLEYWQVDPKGKKSDLHFSWITEFKLNKKTLYPVMRMGRARWKIENETFNTLKNQGYHFEHNYGHGEQNLCLNLVLLMMLAFFVDQVQQLLNPLFQAAWNKNQSKSALWEDIRSKFNEFVVQSMEMIYRFIIGQIKVRYEFYENSG